jgi:tripartite-type tricarboxylate transporter receptor subunit TctC
MKSGWTQSFVFLCGTLAGFNGAHSDAADYPSRPIRFVVPFVPGGSTDIFARLIAPGLSESLGQQVIVDNRGGAGGTIATELVSRAAPDGYTMVLGSANTAMNVSLYGKLSVDPVKAFAPVALLASAPNVLVVHPSLPVKKVEDLLALARSRPGQINYASGGNGSTPHLAAELFKAMTQVNLVHVPYKGTGPAVIAALSGETPVVFPAAAAALPHARSGRLNALGICSLARSDAAPDLPTLSESGVPGYESAQWYGVMVPAGTPRDIVNRLNRELVKAANSPDMKARLLRDATTLVQDTTPQGFATYLKAEIDKWAKVVKFSGARVE